MSIPLEYIFLACVILGINIIPAFMPPTWIILAFFYIQFHFLFFPTIIIGAIMATLGRVILALLSRKYGSRLLPKKLLKNYHSLGEFFEKNQHLTIPAVLMYAFFPIPSNQIYIIAGLSQISLKIIAFSFLVGRLISYSFWVKLSYNLSNDLGTLFIKNVANYKNLFLEILSLLIILFIGIIDWKKYSNKINNQNYI